jgi:agmatine deiminase
MVFIAAELSKRYPHIAALIQGMLSDRDVSCKEISGTGNIWVRDYMPIRTNSHYTKFTYHCPERYPQMRVSPDVWHPYCEAESPVVLDGGNVVMNDQYVLMTDIIFRHNRQLAHDQDTMRRFISSLERTFCREAIFLPVEPGDTLGHMDGIAQFVDSRTVLVNDYSAQGSARYDEYQAAVVRQLRTYGFEICYLPNAYHLAPSLTEKQFRQRYPQADEFNPGYGYYINYYRTNGLLFMPVFNIACDDTTYRLLREYFPNDEIVPVNCSELSMEGGLCHCITWEWESGNNKKLA